MCRSSLGVGLGESWARTSAAAGVGELFVRVARRRVRKEKVGSIEEVNAV
jgi:hypothetical protein